MRGVSSLVDKTLFCAQGPLVTHGMKLSAQCKLRLPHSVVATISSPVMVVSFMSLNARQVGNKSNNSIEGLTYDIKLLTSTGPVMYNLVAWGKGEFYRHLVADTPYVLFEASISKRKSMERVRAA